MKELATDCGSLEISNRLPEARLGHCLTSPEVDPERKKTVYLHNSVQDAMAE